MASEDQCCDQNNAAIERQLQQRSEPRNTGFGHRGPGGIREDLRPLFEAGAMLGERLLPELVKLLDGPAVSYGKGAIVGVAGEMEHGGACVHPMLGKPMRAAVDRKRLGERDFSKRAWVVASKPASEVVKEPRNRDWQQRRSTTSSKTSGSELGEKELLVLMPGDKHGGRYARGCWRAWLAGGCDQDRVATPRRWV
jgi:hypothetical protein